jgi:hypothetical protein
VVGLVAAVVGGTVETVETDTGTVDDVLEVVVEFVVVDAAGIDLLLPTVVVDSRFWRLVSLTGRDPPGDPPSTSAPMHRAAKPSNPAQARQARHLRFCARERFIPSSSTVCRRT